MLFLIAVAIPAVAAAAVLLPHSPSGLRELLLTLGPAAPLIALAAWVLLVPALVPGTLLAAAGGLAFGIAGGVALAFFGAVAGGLAAFALARTGPRAPVERFVARTPRLTSLNAVMERRGFTALLAARLTPGLPAGGLHYAAGVSPVGVSSFVAAMAIGAVMRTVPYALLGEGLGSGSVHTVVIAVASVTLSAVIAALLVRHLRQPVLATA